MGGSGWPKGFSKGTGSLLLKPFSIVYGGRVEWGRLALAL